jgi:hypothetical protein
MTIRTLLIGLVVLFSVSCDKDDEIELNEKDYLIFGHFYGECTGEICVETFKLTNNALFEDTNDNYSGEDFNFVQLGSEIFEQVKDLAEAFPDQLLTEDTDIFGCPDCADGGGLFIQYSENGNVNSWRFDQFKVGVPDYLHPFMDKVNEKINLINH